MLKNKKKVIQQWICVMQNNHHRIRIMGARRVVRDPVSGVEQIDLELFVFTGEAAEQAERMSPFAARPATAFAAPPTAPSTADLTGVLWDELKPVLAPLIAGE